MEKAGTSKAAFWVLFIYFVPLAFSEEILYGTNALFRWPNTLPRGQINPTWLLAAVDGCLFLTSLPFIVWIWVKSRAFRWRLAVWWSAAVGATVALDWLQEDRITPAIQGNPRIFATYQFTAGVIYVALIALALSAALGITPLQVLRRKGETWSDVRATVPLLVGLLVAYTSLSAWDTSLESQSGSLACLSDPGSDCEGVIDAEHFRQLSQIIPVIMIGVGLDAAFFRSVARTPIQRASLLLTVLVLVSSEALIVSALPKSNQGGAGDLLPGWHEYFAFAFGMQAVAIGLATLAWALIANFSGEPEGPVAQHVVEQHIASETRSNLRVQAYSQQTQPRWPRIAGTLSACAIILALSRQLRRDRE